MRFLLSDQEIVFPAFTRSGDEEPVVIESDLVAAHLVATITRRICIVCSLLEALSSIGNQVLFVIMPL